MRTLNHSGNYVIRHGDTLGQIAEEFKSTVEELVVFNPTISNTNLIFPGQQIKLPIHCIELYVERLAADGNGYANEGRRLYQLCQQYGAKPGSTKTWLEQVLACLDRPLPIPDGYQLVPKMLTPLMSSVIRKGADNRRFESWPANCWEGALDVAPVPVLPLREAIRLNIERAQKATGRLSDKAIENALSNPLTREQVAVALADVPPSIGVRNFPCRLQPLIEESDKAIEKVVNADAAMVQRLQKLLDEAQECIDHQRKTLIQQAKAVDETNGRILAAESLLGQIERYLSRTDREQIVSGSTFHKGIRTLLGYNDPVLQKGLHSISCRQFPANAEGVPACRSDCECKPSAPTAPEIPPRAPTSDDCQGILNLEHRWVDSAGGHGRQFCHKCGAVRGPQLSSGDKIDWALNFLSKFEAQQPDEF